jgi:hypothetical protein
MLRVQQAYFIGRDRSTIAGPLDADRQAPMLQHAERQVFGSPWHTRPLRQQSKPAGRPLDDHAPATNLRFPTAEIEPTSGIGDRDGSGATGFVQDLQAVTLDRSAAHVGENPRNGRSSSKFDLDGHGIASRYLDLRKQVSLARHQEDHGCTYDNRIGESKLPCIVADAGVAPVSDHHDAHRRDRFTSTAHRTHQDG